MSDIHPVILCGGSGTRLWPVSRQSYPKQFAPLIGDETLFQGSALRFAADGFAAPLIVTGDPFRFIVTEQLAAVRRQPQAILIEPEGRNTAPAVLAAAVHLGAADPNALMLIAPSDHLITDAAGFRTAVEAARLAAEGGQIVTFGIRPTHPETGYGYLRLGADADPAASAPQPLDSFVEKPDIDHAEAMLDEGDCLWNAGLFLFSARTILGAARAHAPELLTQVDAAVSSATQDLAFTRIDPEAWGKIESISIDYAIMEHADNLAVMPYQGAWSDLGGWEAVRLEGPADARGNVTHGNATAIDCDGSLLRSEAEGLELVGIGLTDLIAVAMPDAVLVAPRDDSQRVREAVDVLRAKGAAQATQSARDHRPWGWFESLAMGDRFQVKRIVVNPGASLSLQSHHHRAEHWIVVAGTARVTINENVQLVAENQSVYIPLGAVHRMENPGKVPMVLIEVQTGTYLGEDDIIRYEDAYART
ncbi:MAG: mannose-1-phosphate guanylyltransferase/mannose-6-phosphate isomerase [Pseudomonadota bacterium]